MIGFGESRVIGLDIGPKYVAAAQVERKGATSVITGLFYREVEWSQENDAQLVSALTDLRKSSLFAGRRVVVGMPANELSIFPLHFAPVGDISVEEALCAEAEKFLPFPAAEAILDYPSLVGSGEEKGATYKALVAAVRRSEIERYLTLLGKAGLSVEAVDLSVSSLVRLHHSVCGTTRNPVILAHIGHSMSLLTIATAQSITIQRIIDWGSGVLLSRLGKEMDLVDDSQKAAAILARYGLSPENDSKIDRTPDAETRAVKRVLYQILAPYLDEFVHEMDKAIGYARVEEGNPLLKPSTSMAILLSRLPWTPTSRIALI